MATDPSEMLGFETKREIGEEQRPDLYSVPSGLEVVAEDFRRILPEAASDDTRVDFLIELIDTLPPETVEIVGQICRSNTYVVSRLGPVLLPEVLRRAVYSDNFTDQQRDELRWMWAQQMNHPGLELRLSALEAFQREEAYLLEKDITTHGMLKPVVERRLNPPAVTLTKIHGPEYPAGERRHNFEHDMVLSALAKAGRRG